MLDVDFFLEYHEHLRAFKDRGWKVVGCLAHEFVPEELLWAARAYPLPLILAGTEDLTHDGTIYLSPTTCVFARALVGMFDPENRTGKFRFLDLIDGVLNTNYCNAENAAIGTIAREHDLHRLDFFLQTTHENPSRDLLLARLRRLRDDLAAFTGVEATPERLRAAIQLYNRARARVKTLLARRIPGSEKLALLQQALLLGPEWCVEHLPAVPADGEVDLQAPPGNGVTSVILTGCPAFVGDPLVEDLEEAGLTVAVQDTWLGPGYAARALPLPADKPGSGKANPLELLAGIYSDCPSPRQAPASTRTCVDRVLATARARGLHGIVHHQLKFCDMVPFQHDVFREQLPGTPFKYLWLERDYASQSSAQIRTRVEAFHETLQEDDS